MTGAKNVESFPIVVRVTGDDYVSLSRLAEEAGADTIHEYIQKVIDRLAAIRNYRDRVEVLNAEGLSNRRIAEETGLTVHQIQDRLKSLGIRSNRESRSA